MIGLMGAGKTTVGRKMAALTGRHFLDTDQELEQRTGVTVSHIFEVEGEQGFRRREHDLLKEIAQQSNQVIATGGGIILDPVNRQTMRCSGDVVYLKVPQNVLWERLRRCKNRPLLQTESPLSTLKKLLDERNPLYSECADKVVSVARGSADRTARQILKLLSEDKDEVNENSQY